jgi:hypothetical protein
MTETIPINAPRRRRRGPELMGAREVADCLGVKVSNLQFIKDLPQPLQELTCGRVWLAAEIRKFAEVYEARREARQTKAA